MPLRADEQAAEVEAADVLHRRAAGLHHLAGGRHVARLEQRVAHRAVAEAADARCARRASAPPTVPPGGRTPPPGRRSASAASSSATGVPAPQRTVISSGRIQLDARRGAAHAAHAAAPARRGCRAPVIVPAPSAPTSSANGEVASDPRARPARGATSPQRRRARQHLAGVGQAGRGRTPRAGAPGRRGRPAANMSGIRSRFSRPMPCSPLSTPPAATDDAHDLLAGGVDPLHHAGLALVEHQQRVEVAVAGVEHVHAPAGRGASAISYTCASTSGSRGGARRCRAGSSSA